MQALEGLPTTDFNLTMKQPNAASVLNHNHVPHVLGALNHLLIARKFQITPVQTPITFPCQSYLISQPSECEKKIDAFANQIFLLIKMHYIYPNASKLPQLHACEQVFDRVVIVVEFEYDFNKCGRPCNSKTYGLPCIRTRDLSVLGRADTFFIIDPASFTGLRDFIEERKEEKSTIHLLGNVPELSCRRFPEF